MAIAIQSFCPLITRITWKSSRYLPFLHSENDVQGLYLLKELCLDGFLFDSYHDPTRYLCERCPVIERLSIKDCVFRKYGGRAKYTKNISFKWFETIRRFVGYAAICRPKMWPCFSTRTSQNFAPL
jgi:hypothetical protein